MLDQFGRLLAVALFAGLLSGGVATIGHQMNTVPTILAAEVYEEAAPAPVHGHGSQAADHAHAPGTAPHAHGAEAWEPENGLERTLYTLLADLLTGVAYALLLAALLTLRNGRAGEVDWREGLLWGLAGFAAFGIAPAIGLPPELPGTPSAPLQDRQAWWIATALLTAGGLALVAFGRRLAPALLGIVLIAAPHLYGAPPAPAEASAVPAALTQRFIAGVTVVGLLSWATLGLAAGWLHGRLWRRTA